MKIRKQKRNEPKYVHVQAHIDKQGHFVLECDVPTTCSMAAFMFSQFNWN